MHPETPLEASNLPWAVRKHLGRLLAQAYADDPPPRGDPDRFADLLDRLEQALAARSGQDESEFRSAFLEMIPRLRRFAMSLTKDAVLAEDLVQDTLMRGWRSRSRFAAGTNLGAWLFTIMRNAFYSLHRKQPKAISGSDGIVESIATIPEQPGKLDLIDAQAALATLPPVMREALVLVAIENLSYEDAARVMRCQIGTVKSRVWRARHQLAQALGYDAGDLGVDGATLSIVAASGKIPVG